MSKLRPTLPTVALGATILAVLQCGNHVVAIVFGVAAVVAAAAYLISGKARKQ